MASDTWYPGHIARARRAVEKELPLIDTVIEAVDARAPNVTRPSAGDRLYRGKQVVRALIKRDLADEGMTRAWLAYLRQGGIAAAVAVDARRGRGIDVLRSALRTTGPRRGSRPPRAMVVGVPNVGKSSLINRLAGHDRARTGAAPGITRGRQWIKVEGWLDLLDTPGLLFPQSARGGVATILAVLGVLPDSVFDPVEAARWLIEYLASTAPDVLSKRYGVDGSTPGVEKILTEIARRRGCLLPGGTPDVRRSAVALLTDFRHGRLGAFTLEGPPRAGPGPAGDARPGEEA